MTSISQFKRALSVAKKNLHIYYLKGPVIIFGMLLPLFFFITFLLGREVSPLRMATGLVGMALWFTSTSISPVITPWETRTKTLERLISSPIGYPWILLGDMLASAFIGIMVTIVPLSIALLALDLAIVNPLLLGVGVILGSFCFSAIGVLMAALPTDTPSDVMMLSSLIKFPITFISGIFVPISQLPSWGQAISHLSPLTYLTNLVQQSFGEGGSLWLSPTLNVVILTVFLLIFMALAVVFHRKTLPKRL